MLYFYYLISLFSKEREKDYGAKMMGRTWEETREDKSQPEYVVLEVLSIKKERTILGQLVIYEGMTINFDSYRCSTSLKC